MVELIYTLQAHPSRPEGEMLRRSTDGGLSTCQAHAKDCTW